MQWKIISIGFTKLLNVQLTGVVRLLLRCETKYIPELIPPQMALEFRLGYADVPNVRTWRVHDATLGRWDAFVIIHEAFLPLFFTRLHRLKGAVVQVRRAVIGYGRSRTEEVKAADDGEYFGHFPIIASTAMSSWSRLD